MVWRAYVRRAKACSVLLELLNPSVAIHIMGQQVSSLIHSTSLPSASNADLESSPTTEQVKITGILKSTSMYEKSTGQISGSHNKVGSYSHHVQYCWFTLFHHALLIESFVFWIHQHVQWSKVHLHCLPCGTREKSLLCGECKFQSTSIESLDLHMRETHPISTVALQSPLPDMKKFQCSLCPFKAKLKRAFKQHNVCHRRKSAKYRCPICGYSVDHLGNFNRHLNLHSGELVDNNGSYIGDHEHVIILMLYNQKSHSL